MTQIIFISQSGQRHAVEAEDGLSVMQVARNNDIEAIDGDCGGECACATCRVLIPMEWLDLVGKAPPDEHDLLEFKSQVPSNARLSCQIEVRSELEGLVVLLPKNQDSAEFYQSL